MEELKSKYPGRKILVVDTLAASMGEGLLVYDAAQLQKQGAAIEEMCIRDSVHPSSAAVVPGPLDSPLSPLKTTMRFFFRPLSRYGCSF